MGRKEGKEKQVQGQKFHLGLRSQSPQFISFFDWMSLYSVLVTVLGTTTQWIIRQSSSPHWAYILVRRPNKSAVHIYICSYVQAWVCVNVKCKKAAQGHGSRPEKALHIIDYDMPSVRLGKEDRVQQVTHVLCHWSLLWWESQTNSQGSITVPPITCVRTGQVGNTL